MEKGCRSVDTPRYLRFFSLRGLDLNQRPLGYEPVGSCRLFRLEPFRAVLFAVRAADFRPVPSSSAWFVCKWFAPRQAKCQNEERYSPPLYDASREE
jgi:hypothetical protein